VGRAIRTSLASSVSETWVSTEDPEIREVALGFGAMVIDRPGQLAGDTTSTEDVMLHFARHVDFDVLLLMQCTCPLTIPGDIDRVLAMMDRFDSVLTVTRIHQFVWTDGEPVYDPKCRPRRQEAPPVFLETGGVYAVSRETLLKERCRIGGRVGFVEVPNSRSFDIDTEDDVELVRRLVEGRRG